jgi:beta-lactamase regulating signal transducer with metallopeptidase domain
MIHLALWVLSPCCLFLLVTILVRRQRRVNRLKAEVREESLIELTNRVYEKHIPSKDASNHNEP